MPAVSTKITGYPLKVHRHLDRVAGRARERRGYRHVPAGERIHQGGFADVRRTGDHHDEALPKPLGGSSAHERPVNPVGCAADRRARRRRGEIGGVLDVGEIELRLDRRHRFDNEVADGVAFPFQGAARDPLRLPALSLRLGLYEIGEPLDFREVDLAVGESPPGELAGFSGPDARKAGKGAGERGGNRTAAGDMEFRHLVAGETSRRRETDDKRPVDDLSRLRILERPQDGGPIGKGCPPRQGLKRNAAQRTRQAKHRDRGASDAARLREDRFLGIGQHGGRPSLLVPRPFPLRAYFAGGVQTTYWSAMVSRSPCFSRWK